MFRFLHAADIHLDSPLRGLERYEDAPVDEVRGATRKALENLVELAIEEEVAFVLLAGDLYDGDWRDYNTGLFLVGQMNRLREAGIRVFLVSGNHDAASRITRDLRLPENVVHFSHRKPHTERIDDLNVAIHGQSFASRSVKDDLAAGFPVADPSLLNIGLLHTSLDGRPPHGDYAPTTLDVLRSRGYAYWALGHVHRHETVSRDPWVVFSGNSQGRHAGETGAKGCVLVTVENDEIQGIEWRELDVVRWERVSVDVAAASSGDATIELVRAAFEAQSAQAGDRLLAVRLVLEGASSAHADLARDADRWIHEYRAQASALPGALVWLEKVEVRTLRPASLEDELKRDDAFGDLLRTIAALEADSVELSTLAPELADLKAKLPPELAAGDDPFDPTAPEVLRAALRDVKEILLSRLLEGEGGT